MNEENKLDELKTENQYLKEKINSLENEFQDYKKAIFGFLNPIQHSIDAFLGKAVTEEDLFTKKHSSEKSTNGNSNIWMFC